MSKSEMVRLAEISAATLYQVLELSVQPDQEKYVASNAWSVAQAYFHPEAWFRGIYRGDKAVGFAMLEDWSQVPEAFNAQPISLWRFMIDRREQGKGYGRAALALIAEHARSRSSLDHYLTSCTEGPHSPKRFYLSCGFAETGEIVEGETVLKYSFER